MLVLDSAGSDNYRRVGLIGPADENAVQSDVVVVGPVKSMYTDALAWFDAKREVRII